VTRPEDLYQLEPGRWHVARQLWLGDEPCNATECEAGYTQGDLVVSAYHKADKVFIIASLRSCASPAFSELDIGERASNSERRRVGKQVERVLRGLGKTCKMTTPNVPRSPATGCSRRGAGGSGPEPVGYSSALTASSAAAKPIFECCPSQNGLVVDPPQRHRNTRFCPSSV
jgi:hypothetical protein